MLKKDSVDWGKFTLQDFKDFLLDELESPCDCGRTATLRLADLRQRPGQSIQVFSAEYNDARDTLDPDIEMFWSQFFLSKVRDDLALEIMRSSASLQSIDEIAQEGARLERLQARERQAKNRQQSQTGANPNSTSATAPRGVSGANPSQGQPNRHVGTSGESQGSQPKSGDKRKREDGSSQLLKKQRSRGTAKELAAEEKVKRKRLKAEGRCYECEETGHQARDCPRKKGGASSTK